MGTILETMAKIDITTKKQIIYLANMLPLVMIETHEKHIMTKEELDEMGYVGAEDLGDGRYIYRMPVRLAQNHVRFMIKAYRIDGYNGISHYIDSVNSLKDAPMSAV